MLPDSTHKLLDPIMPELKQIAASHWEDSLRPGVQPRSTVRFRARVENPTPGALEPYVMNAKWLESWKSKGAIAAVCEEPRGLVCEQGQETIVATITAIRLVGDSAEVEVDVSTAPDFFAKWGFQLRRRGGAWHLVSKELWMIT